jgi:hypothetical protein
MRVMAARHDRVSHREPEHLRGRIIPIGFLSPLCIQRMRVRLLRKSMPTKRSRILGSPSFHRVPFCFISSRFSWLKASEKEPLQLPAIVIQRWHHRILNWQETTSARTHWINSRVRAASQLTLPQQEKSILE